MDQRGSQATEIHAFLFFFVERTQPLLQGREPNVAPAPVRKPARQTAQKQGEWLPSLARFCTPALTPHHKAFNNKAAWGCPLAITEAERGPQEQEEEAHKEDFKMPHGPTRDSSFHGRHSSREKGGASLLMVAGMQFKNPHTAGDLASFAKPRTSNLSQMKRTALTTEAILPKAAGSRSSSAASTST